MDADILEIMPKHMADVLREAIRKSGLTALALSTETGVSQPTITEFLRGKDIRMTTADKLARRLGLALTPRNPNRPAKG